jgi:hypothetical protein
MTLDVAETTVERLATLGRAFSARAQPSATHAPTMSGDPKTIARIRRVKHD